MVLREYFKYTVSEDTGQANVSSCQETVLNAVTFTADVMSRSKELKGSSRFQDQGSHSKQLSRHKPIM
jgi:hypothetical protein